MFIFRNFLIAVASILNTLLSIYIWIIIIRALISWFSPNPYNTLVRLLIAITEPVLAPIRRYVPSMGIDISPIIVIVAIEFIKRFIIASLFDLARTM
ncbi:MAG: YggT family protein [Candidatus Cloacimonadota bacterium]|nr:MAG: YggT family protein [Candidatus Cloacimonadota bacterium]